ncbi:receptor-like protein kinase THESEUS 1 [Camellia sinensis]|uniref:receptor-like protein kinase THESEUS 1 n=1 Tax=Camellia sinensis TaxID=4442 RepID=UPI00103685DE|nr:receptor-like protein kinase THESEUS 1 [Camellia sinensis]
MGHDSAIQKGDLALSFLLAISSIGATGSLPDNVEGWGMSLVRRFMNGIETVDQVIDPNLIGKIAPKCLKEFVNIALSCLIDQANWRPSIDIVVRSLQSALLLQEAWENHCEIGAELPVIDLSCCSVFSIDGCMTIGGVSPFPSNSDDDLPSNPDGESNGYLSDPDFDKLIR